MNRYLQLVTLCLLVAQALCLDSCSLSAEQLTAQDPNLKEMKYDLGEGEQTFLAYVPPNVSTFYLNNPPSSKVVRPKHEGLGAKFINLSSQNVQVYWEAQRFDFDKGTAMVIRSVPAFSAKGTSSFPLHSFVFALEDGTFLKRTVIDPSDGNLHSYDPYLVEDDEEATGRRITEELPEREQTMYWKWRNTLRFDTYYRTFTGRSYLASFPRQPPMHFMWPAQYFEQQHWVTTRETHFITAPKELAHTSVELKYRGDKEPVDLETYRSAEPFLNMTLSVLSCEPRVFEIRNFLSIVEVEHILEIADMMTLGESTLGDEQSKSRSVRTSRNTWVGRKQSPIVDAIYRRAADLMRIDESLMRPRAEGEKLHVPDHRPFLNSSIAEELQLVHYSPGQEYQTHHDFAYRPLSDVTDSARFATLLLYLNDDMEGGETSFPKFANAHTFKELKVKPEIGKAVLFYSQLADGNMDELSQHRAHAVRQGTKWLINLWVWDPVRDRRL